MIDLQAVFDDLSTRFVINCPDEELQSFERLFFQLEQAHWYYEDFVREQHRQLPTYHLKAFSQQFFAHCPLLQPYQASFDEGYGKFSSYKSKVPCFGAIILNKSLDKMVLVKGWTARSSWGFPKGKVNKDECDFDCAVREVYEEIGLDISPFVNNPDTDHFTVNANQQRTKLFLATGVPQDYPFETHTRKEISKIDWFTICDVKHSNQFFLVVPFLQPLRAWIDRSLNKTHNMLGISPPRSSRKNAPESGRNLDRHNQTTFGMDIEHWGVDEMFRVNEQLFGVKSDYSFDLYTTKLPGRNASKSKTTTTATTTATQKSSPKAKRQAPPPKKAATNGVAPTPGQLLLRLIQSSEDRQTDDFTPSTLSAASSTVCSSPASPNPTSTLLSSFSFSGTCQQQASCAANNPMLQFSFNTTDIMEPLAAIV